MQSVRSRETQRNRLCLHVLDKAPSAPDKVSSLAQTHANNPVRVHITATTVQCQQAVVSIATLPSKEKPGPSIVCFLL